MKAALGAILISISLVACTHSLHTAHVSDFSPTFRAFEKGKVVEARAEQFTVMGWIGENNYVNQCFEQLMQQCPGGDIQGIVTQHSTSHGFFSWTNSIEMKGLCVAR